MKTVIVISIITVAVIGIYLIAYSYSQIQLRLDDISIANIEWSPSSISTLLKLAVGTITGNILGTLLSLIVGVKLNLVFVLSNHGIFPVYIPNLSYDLSINDIQVGKGNSNVGITINPGESRNLLLLQDFQIKSLELVTNSIAHSNGIINLQINGTAYFKFMGMTMPIPFKSTKQFSIMDEIKNHLNNLSQGG